MSNQPNGTNQTVPATGGSSSTNTNGLASNPDAANASQGSAPEAAATQAQHVLQPQHAASPLLRHLGSWNVKDPQNEDQYTSGGT
ncbi:hypothetical protein BJ508DRAFT_328105 [Ascobolus immersus RN42]|uniref:Uncharacterized protein n=1 Tax=Ascobolus immersus RN42 TaxID=1160509 RepID=A0A3N4I0P8_ASCIM|nr:hypothetical protein BJ508DRAFT_328105 [Ascobolus immersus RN42]